MHELAHEVLHWEGKGKRPEGPLEGKQAKEIDAEATSYIVLKHYGFESNDAPNYLALWKAKGEEVKARRENIRKSVQMIIQGIDSKMKNNVLTEAKNKMKIIISKAQWEEMGRKAGWDKKDVVNPKKKGMWEGYTQEELKEKLHAAKARQEKRETADPKDSTLIKELNFALRAKHGWGKAE